MSTVLPSKERLGLPLFFAMLLLSWIGAIPMVLASYGKHIPGFLRPLQILMLFGPGLVACFAAWVNGGKKGMIALLRGLTVWKVNPGWYLATIAGPVLLFALSLVTSNAFGFTNAPFPAPIKALSTFAITFAVYFFLNTEELAWRGYALPRLQSRFGPLRATILLAVLWTLFHLPLFWMNGGHPAGYPLWLFFLMIAGISLPFTIVYNGTGGSILLAHMLHQSFNASVEAIPIFPAAVHSLAPIGISVVALFVISLGMALKPERDNRSQSTH